MQNIYRKFCLEFSNIKMSLTAFCRGRPSNVQLRDTYVYANMSMTMNASKVLPKSLSELTLMSGETITENLNDMDCTRPI